jgi:large subunit ribosomal protein L20
MPRAKGGFKTRRRRNKILKSAGGYRGAKSRLIRQATEAVKRGMRYATRHRKLKKRDFRKLWIARLGAAAREEGMSYSELMGRLLKAKIGLNRKVLSELAIHNPQAFAKVVEAVR